MQLDFRSTSNIYTFKAMICVMICYVPIFLEKNVWKSMNVFLFTFVWDLLDIVMYVSIVFPEIKFDLTKVQRLFHA